jgi:RecA/RadA recombinase
MAKKKEKDEGLEKKEKKSKSDQLQEDLDFITSKDYFNSKLKFIKSGISIFDAYIAGEKNLKSLDIGIPVGKMIGVSGNHGVGKSTTFMEISKRFNIQGMKVLYIDIENGLNIKSITDYGLLPYAAYDKRIEEPGLADSEVKEIKRECLNQFLNGEKLFYSLSPKTYMETMKTIRLVHQYNKKKEIKLIVVDSIKDCIRSEFLENDDAIEDQKMMVDAKTQEYFLIALKNFCEMNEICLIVLNQLRTKVKGQFYVLDEAGGQAWLHRCSIRLMVKPGEDIIIKKRNNLGEIEDKKIGNWIVFEMRKGRFGNSFTKLAIPVLFGKGVSLLHLYYKKLENCKVVKKAGSWTTFSMPELGIEEKYQGLKRGMQILKEHFVEIEQFIIDKNLLFVEEDVEEVEEQPEEKVPNSVKAMFEDDSGSVDDILS